MGVVGMSGLETFHWWSWNVQVHFVLVVYRVLTGAGVWLVAFSQRVSLACAWFLCSAYFDVFLCVCCVHQVFLYFLRASLYT